MSLLGDVGLVLISQRKEEKRIKKGVEINNNLPAQLKAKVEKLSKAAESGDIRAAHQLGSMYIEGDEIGYNPSLAVKYLKIAANKGNFDSCYTLALYYRGYWSNAHEYAYDSYRYYLLASKCSYNNQKYITEVQRAIREDFSFNKNEKDERGNPLVWFKKSQPIR